MELVMGGLSALAIVLIVLWALSLKSSVAHDREAAAERERAARLYQKGVRLRCLGCGQKFGGPLTNAGCPKCHLAAFVVTEADYKESLRNKEN